MTEGAELQWLPQSVEVCRKRLPDFRKVTVNRLCGERSRNAVSVRCCAQPSIAKIIIFTYPLYGGSMRLIANE